MPRHDGTAAPATRVEVTPEAAALLRRLRGLHGPLMFHQSGGCCDGSSPMCYPAGEFLVGDADVHLGDLDIDDPDAGPDPGLDRGPGDADGGPTDATEGIPVFMGRQQFAYWQHTHLTIDVVPGRGAGFSLESPEGVRFIIRSRLLTEDELDALTPGWRDS